MGRFGTGWGVERPVMGMEGMVRYGNGNESDGSRF